MKLQVGIIIALVIIAVLASGCSSLNSNISPGMSGTEHQAVQATPVGQHDHWDFSRGCYYSANYQVYNTGNTTAKNVRLVVELVHINDNAVRDTREVFIGTLGPGASTDAAVELDGECLKDYNLRAFTAYD